MNVLLLGPPGSGKGTQAKRMASEYRLTHIEPGEIFRAAIAARTRIGLQIQPIVAAGKLVPDSLTIELIRERLSRLGREEGFVLDGFPRTIAQAEHLDRLLNINALSEAHLPVVLSGRSVRVPDTPAGEVERVLQQAALATRITAVPSTLDETLITLGRAAARTPAPQ